MNLTTKNKTELESLTRGFKHAIMNAPSSPFLDDRFVESLAVPDIFEDWIKAIRQENLDFLFYKKANKAQLELPQTKGLELLKKEYGLEKGLYALKRHETRKIDQRMQQAQIPYLFLKGLALGGLLKLGVYKRSVDIDLLFRKEDLEKALVNLRSLNYRRLPGEANGEFPMIHPTGTQLDVHYELTASSPFIYMSRISVSPLFKSPLRVTDAGLSLPGLNMEWTLVYLCLHFGINHQYNDFILIFEIQQFLEKYEEVLNWRAIKKIVAKYDLKVVSGIVFLLLAEFCEAKSEEYRQRGKELLKTEKEFKRVVDFMTQHNMLDCLWKGVHNGLQTNDIPAFCADTYWKRKRFKKGNMAWANGKYF